MAILLCHVLLEGATLKSMISFSSALFICVGCLITDEGSEEPKRCSILTICRLVDVSWGDVLALPLAAPLFCLTTLSSLMAPLLLSLFYLT